jgi:hypothetical protein
MNMKFRLLAVLWAMPMILTLSASALAQMTSPAPKTIDVTGHGESSGKPDLMTLSFAVTSHSESADECTRNQAEVSRRVVDVLKAKLGDSGKVTTSDFSFNPSMEYGNAMPRPVAMTTPEPPATWRFSGEVDVYTDTIDPMADLIETGMTAGATSVGESNVQEVPDWDSTAPAVSSGTSSATGTGEYRRMARSYRLGLSVETAGVSAADARRKGVALSKLVETALRDKVGGNGKVRISTFGVNQLNPQQR